MSDERVQLLNSIGFWWEQDLDALWRDTWQQVLAFYKQHQHWPKSNEEKIGSWCNIQRKSKKQGILSAERIALLDTVGFIWTTDTAKSLQKR